MVVTTTAWALALFTRRRLLASVFTPGSRWPGRSWYSGQHMRACAWVLSLHAPYRHRLHCLSSLTAFISQALVFKAQVVLELTIESSCAVLDVLLLQLPRVFVRAPFGCQLGGLLLFPLACQVCVEHDAAAPAVGSPEDVSTTLGDHTVRLACYVILNWWCETTPKLLLDRCSVSCACCVGHAISMPAYCHPRAHECLTRKVGGQGYDETDGIDEVESVLHVIPRFVRIR